MGPDCLAPKLSATSLTSQHCQHSLHCSPNELCPRICTAPSMVPTFPVYSAKRHLHACANHPDFSRQSDPLCCKLGAAAPLCSRLWLACALERPLSSLVPSLPPSLLQDLAQPFPEALRDWCLTGGWSLVRAPSSPRPLFLSQHETPAHPPRTTEGSFKH